MEQSQTICLLNDSFPPNVDGVVNTVVNYALQLQKEGHTPMVITPANPEARDADFPFPVVRYPSIVTDRFDGYPAGVPFSPEVARNVTGRDISILHAHCPIASGIMARQLRQITNAPIVMTYHTKFDVDIKGLIRQKPMQQLAKKAIVDNISACDEVWAVSHGAGENLRALGYEGEYIVMPNGVDMSCRRATEAQIQKVTESYDLPEGVPVYLFVGRIKWYKGLRIILDALAQLRAENRAFRMVFVGEGSDKDQVMAYAGERGLADVCFFTGTIRDREALRAWYSRADLFLFPSTFDTNGLVVREAAACSLPSVLIRGSCAAEGVLHGRNGFLIEENPESLARCLCQLNPEVLKKAGIAARDELYISWETAVAHAMDRYEIVKDRYKSGNYPRRRKPMDTITKRNGELMKALSRLSIPRHDEKVLDSPLG